MYGQPLPNTTSNFTHELITVTWTFWKLARAYPPLQKSPLDFASHPDVIWWAWKWASRTSDSQIVPRTGDGALEPKHKLPNHTGDLLFSQTDNLLTSSRFHTRSPAGCKPQGPSSPQKQDVQHQKPIPLPSPRGTPPHCSPRPVPGDGEGRRGGHQARSSPGTDSPARSHVRAARRGTSLGRRRQNGFGGFLLCSPPPSSLPYLSRYVRLKITPLRKFGSEIN